MSLICRESASLFSSTIRDSNPYLNPYFKADLKPDPDKKTNFMADPDPKYDPKLLFRIRTTALRIWIHTKISLIRITAYNIVSDLFMQRTISAVFIYTSLILAGNTD